MSPPPDRRVAPWLRAACAAHALLLAGSPAQAQTTSGGEQPALDATSFTDGLWTRDYLLGDGSGRNAGEDAGITVDAYYNVYQGWNVRGGENTAGARRFSHSLDLFVRADTERLGLWSGGTVLMQVKNNLNENINPDVGGLSQAVDDADFDEPIYIDQLYYEQELHGSRARLRVGYLDYQTLIDRNAYANSEDVQFMNAALDNNLLVPLKIGLGAALVVKPFDDLEILLGTADAENELRSAGLDTAFDDDALMAYLEVTARASFDGARGELPGNYRWGIYYDPRRQPDFGEMRETTGTVGTWLSLDQMVYREQETDLQGLGLFYRYAYRQEESYAISQMHSAGLEYRGLLRGRDADALGFGFYDLVSSDDYVDAVDPDFGGEAGFESYYRIQVSPWLAITPGVQYIEDPGGLDTSRDALAFVLRTRARF